MPSFRHFLLLLLPFFFSCGNSDSKNGSTAADELTVQVDTFVTMTTQQAQNLYDNADKVDVLFSNVGVSLSQVKKSDVQGQVSFMTPRSVPKNSGCKESANIIYQSNGEIIGDGRMYLSDGCNYVVFYEDNVAIYAAQMTEQGMKFYSQILSAGARGPGSPQ